LRRAAHREDGPRTEHAQREPGVGVAAAQDIPVQDLADQRLRVTQRAAARGEDAGAGQQRRERRLGDAAAAQGTHRPLTAAARG